MNLRFKKNVATDTDKAGGTSELQATAT